MNSVKIGSIISGVPETPKVFKRVRPGLVLGTLQKWLKRPSVKTQTWRVLLSDLLTPCPVYSEHFQFAISDLYHCLSSKGSGLIFLDVLNRKILATEHKSISPA